MYPVLISAGPFVIYSLSVCIIIAWAFYSFLFWRTLKDEGVDDEKIFNITFYATIAAFIVSRLSFVAFHWKDFFPALLKIAALWVAPGLTYYGALIGAMTTSILLCKKYKLRIGLILDALAAALPAAGMIGSIGALLDGASVGKETALPWGISYVGQAGRRHPVEFYAFLVFALTAFILFVLFRTARNRMRTRGLYGIWFTILVSAGMFVVEFARASPVYWQGLTPNQWISLAVFSEGAGALYVKGGGREWLAKTGRLLRERLTKITGRIYDRLARRFPGKNPETAK